MPPVATGRFGDTSPFLEKNRHLWQVNQTPLPSYPAPLPSYVPTIKLYTLLGRNISHFKPALLSRWFSGFPQVGYGLVPCMVKLQSDHKEHWKTISSGITIINFLKTWCFGPGLLEFEKFRAKVVADFFTRTSLDCWFYIPTAILLCIYLKEIYIYIYRHVIYDTYIYMIYSSKLFYKVILSYPPVPRPGACRCHVCGLARKQHHMLKASFCQWFNTCCDFRRGSMRMLRMLRILRRMSLFRGPPVWGILLLLLLSQIKKLPFSTRLERKMFARIVGIQRKK